MADDPNNDPNIVYVDLDENEEEMEVKTPGHEEMSSIIDALKEGRVYFFNQEDMLRDGLTTEKIIEIILNAQKKNLN